MLFESAFMMQQIVFLSPSSTIGWLSTLKTGFQSVISKYELQNNIPDLTRPLSFHILLFQILICLFVTIRMIFSLLSYYRFNIAFVFCVIFYCKMFLFKFSSVLATITIRLKTTKTKCTFAVLLDQSADPKIFS